MPKINSSYISSLYERIGDASPVNAEGSGRTNSGKNSEDPNKSSSAQKTSPYSTPNLQTPKLKRGKLEQSDGQNLKKKAKETHVDSSPSGNNDDANTSNIPLIRAAGAASKFNESMLVKEFLDRKSIPCQLMAICAPRALHKLKEALISKKTSTATKFFFSNHTNVPCTPGFYKDIRNTGWGVITTSKVWIRSHVFNSSINGVAVESDMPGYLAATNGVNDGVFDNLTSMLVTASQKAIEKIGEGNENLYEKSNFTKRINVLNKICDDIKKQEPTFVSQLEGEYSSRPYRLEKKYTEIIGKNTPMGHDLLSHAMWHVFTVGIFAEALPVVKLRPNPKSDKNEIINAYNSICKAVVEIKKEIESGGIHRAQHKISYNNLSFGNAASLFNRDNTTTYKHGTKVSEFELDNSIANTFDFDNKIPGDILDAIKFDNDVGLGSNNLRAANYSLLKNSAKKFLYGTRRNTENEESSDNQLQTARKKPPPTPSASKAILAAIKASSVSISEYSATDAIFTVLSFKHKMGLDANDFGLIDPCAGWGQRVYVASALMKSKEISKFYGSDPNMENNKIRDYMGHLNGLGLDVPDPNDNNSPMNLRADTISNSLKLFEDTKGNDKFELMFSCPPYADTQTQSNEPISSVPPAGKTVLYENYCPEDVYTLDDFVREFGFNLVSLGAFSIRENGYFCMQFNRQHALTLATILQKSGYFEEVTVCIGPLASRKVTSKNNNDQNFSTEKFSQVLVYAKRNGTTIQKRLDSSQEQINIVRQSEVFKQLKDNGSIKEQHPINL